MAAYDLVIFSSCAGLSPMKNQAITWPNADLSPIEPTERNSSEIWIEVQNFYFIEEMHMKLSFAKGQPLYPSPDVFKEPLSCRLSSESATLSPHLNELGPGLHHCSFICSRFIDCGSSNNQLHTITPEPGIPRPHNSWSPADRQEIGEQGNGFQYKDHFWWTGFSIIRIRSMA